MGWNYEREDDEPKKEYPSVGVVTLSTDEYRDMMEAIYKARKAADSEHEDWRKEYQKRSDLEDQIKKLEENAETITKKLQELTDWMAAENLADKFKLWKTQKMMTEEE